MFSIAAYSLQRDLFTESLSSNGSMRHNIKVILKVGYVVFCEVCLICTRFLELSLCTPVPSGNISL
jgi:hypothetical protein